MLRGIPMILNGEYPHENIKKCSYMFFCKKAWRFRFSSSGYQTFINFHSHQNFMKRNISSTCFASTRWTWNVFLADLKDFELASFSGGQTLLGIHLGQLEPWWNCFFFSEEKHVCEKRKHGNTLCVAMMCCVFNENSFHFCFLWLLEASLNFTKDRTVLKVLWMIWCARSLCGNQYSASCFQAPDNTPNDLVAFRSLGFERSK